MSSLSDFIEKYLKQMLREAAEGMIMIQRRELAEMFECAPSQINYVLDTRFTPDRGYLVETRRGGGGYIRIVRLSFRPGRDFLSVLDETIGDEITARRAEGLLVRLEEESIVTLDEYVFIKTVLDRETRKFPDHYRGRVRASLLKAMLALLVRE
ncbi:MAG: CtsR family transcriptional regulator [Bacillota bacterium]|nr:CtsR family transcriptional regulator [Bacillota bacterium]NLD12481.1 CtsR family transcriptional regulator [Bacillota bacterium]HAV21069.1 transcriptional regulator [Bacillota bacterium]HOB88872.1 CtsR family transcriptional regulator [Bacillota bacterium]HOJ57839.1 CtsR family transcriptional regulator [Bacillota bacterium]